MYAEAMAILTPLPGPAAHALGAAYGLEVEAARGIPAGSVNSNFALELVGGGRAFLRVYEEQGMDGAAREVRLLEHLATRGVPTPRPMARQDAEGTFTTHAGKPVAVFPWVEGETACQARVTRGRARAVGAALADVHHAGESFEGLHAGRFGVEALRARLRDLPPEARAGELGDAVRILESRIAETWRAEDASELPMGVAHGDLFRDNVLWQPRDDGAPGERIAALLDFESASRQPLVFDLAVTALAWCFGDELEAPLLTALGEGYASVRPLEEAEVAALPAVIRFAALRFAITRITDFELRRGAGVYKDYRRFVARLAALDAAGDAGIRRWLGGV
jgi:homoserine kinase type II